MLLYNCLKTTTDAPSPHALPSVRPLKAEIERRCLVACRKQKSVVSPLSLFDPFHAYDSSPMAVDCRFIEMSEGGPALDALVYLQTQLHAVIRHDDPAEYVPL